MSILSLVVHALSAVGAHLSVYVTLGVTSIFAEEIAPVVAGFAAHQGELRVVGAAIACALGSWLADIGLFELGRRHAVRLTRRWPALRTTVARLRRAVRRRPWHAAMAVRFAYGARLLLPITCGAARMPRRRFVIGSGISAFTWSTLFTLVGWLFGHTAVLVLGHVRHYEKRLALVLALVVLIGILIVQRRNAARVAGEIGGPDPAQPYSAHAGQARWTPRLAGRNVVSSSTRTWRSRVPFRAVAVRDRGGGTRTRAA